MAVDIGAEAINRASTIVAGLTFINKEHPATIAGLITSVDVWAHEEVAGLIVGTFYTTNGNTLKCRASQAIAGTIPAGSKVTKVVSIAVEVGDYIGAYWTEGILERDITGYAGYWGIEGEYIDPDDEGEYFLIAGDAISFGGYIPGAAVGRSFGFIIG